MEIKFTLERGGWTPRSAYASGVRETTTDEAIEWLRRSAAGERLPRSRVEHALQVLLNAVHVIGDPR